MTEWNVFPANVALVVMASSVHVSRPKTNTTTTLIQTLIFDLDRNQQQKATSSNQLSSETNAAKSAASSQVPNALPNHRLSSLSFSTKQSKKIRRRHADVKGSPATFENDHEEPAMRAWSRRTAQSRKPSSSRVLANIRDELHLRLAENEVVDCFMQTKASQADSGRGGHSRSTKVTSVYREVYALKGSLAWEFTFDDHRVGTLNKGCQTLGDLDLATCCVLRVRVPRGQYVELAIRKHYGSKVRLFDEEVTSNVYDDFNATDGDFINTLVFVATSNAVNILQSAQKYKKGETGFVNQVYIRFQAVDRPGVQVKRTAANKGVVQTAFYHEFSQLLNPIRDPWAYVIIPSGHVVMVSSLTFIVLQLSVVLYAADRDNETLTTMDFKQLNPPHANIYNTSSLLVRLNNARLRSGFQLRFSFHNDSAPPERLSDGSWNCSVPYASDFLPHHLSCNKEVECHDAADEANCSYTSDICGPRYLTLGRTACIFYVRRSRRVISWNEASKVCSDRGGRLAVLNTPAKWKDAVRLMPNVISKTYSLLVFVGVTNTRPGLPLWYTKMYQWTDDTTAFYLHSESSIGFRNCKSETKITCGYLRVVLRRGKTGFVCAKIGCEIPISADILCEKKFPPKPVEAATILSNTTDRWSRDTAYIQCPLGHYTHQFLACDLMSSCWLRQQFSRCDASLTPLPPSFTCSDLTTRVPYTLVCDYRFDCVDGSDEDFCDSPRCPSGEHTCDNGQCIPRNQVCNGWEDCLGREDEELCGKSHVIQTTVSPPAVVTLNDNGQLLIHPLDPALSGDRGIICPDTHFRCPDGSYCLPFVLRCNGAYDCPGYEDESGCDTCPGFYRCRGSRVCLQYEELCNGRSHCPQHDDELMCGVKCPRFCICRGLAFFCRQNFTASAYPLLRFLDASSSEITSAQLTDNKMLVHLILANCSLDRLDGLSLPRLLFLGVQDNRLSSLHRLHSEGMPRLKDLSLAGNPLALEFEGAGDPLYFPEILKLDLSRVVLHDLDVSVLSTFPKLRVLNLSDSGIQQVKGEGFRDLQQLRVLDLRGCPMTWFPRGMFQGLGDLQAVHADSFKVCCSKVLPTMFNIRNCYAPSNEISSCDDLLRGNGYSVCVFVLSLLSLIGNAVSFVFRTYFSKRETKLGYGNFVTHLSISDFLMGMYLAIIGVADQVYRGTYLWNDESWRNSVTCKFTGFLSLLSSETSVLIMCLITLDRFLVLRFPFSRLHFSPGSAHLVSAVVWIVGVLLAMVPLLPVTSHWEFYSQTGICIPLPITRKDFAGQNYSFGILIIFNFVVFVFISLGQLFIYWSIISNSMSVSNTSKKTKDLSIARRLITVAMTDFMCWFPIGVLGLLASNDVPVSSEVNVVVAIFVLPLNAAVNPCLYTFNVIMERRGRAREEKLRALLLAQLKANS